ncbi:MAG TPA: substrate-binding domain-containing protein [Thermoclostridium caenicola]|nr:substrate-binding domain-containing protein [Thermoclostridium caenicola]
MRIGFLTSSIYGHYGQALSKSLWRELEPRNCSLIIFEGYSLINNTVADYHCNVLHRMISQGSIDALVLSGQLSSKLGVELVQDLATKAGLPSVSLGIELEGIPAVSTDNFSGFEQIVSHLISHGYHKLAHISGPLKNPEALLRRDAFLKVIYQNGLEVPKHFLLEGNFSDIGGYHLTKKLIPHIRAKEIDALVCANDDTASGAIKCLNENGLSVPRDVAVTGFDDVGDPMSMVQTLTTVSQPMEEMCRKAVELLLDEQPDRFSGLVYTLQPRLIIRHSCGCKDSGHPVSNNPGPIFNPLRTHRRFQSLDETAFYSALTDCLSEYGMNACYIVRYLTPTRFDDYASARQNLKGTMLYGYSDGRKVQYATPFEVSRILPDPIYGTLDGITFVKPIFIGKNQLGYIIMSAPENLVATMANLCLEVQQYMENAFLAYEKQQVEMKLSDTLERLINTNRKLNELTVRDNLDKMKKIRSLANNMLQNRKADSGEYYLILVEIDNFFEINAEYGFEEGERVMNEVTRILSGSIREDDFLSHESCERYMVLIKNIHGDAIHAIEERFRKKLEELNNGLDKPYKVSFSWGYARASVDSDFEQVYTDAEADLASRRHSAAQEP